MGGHDPYENAKLESIDKAVVLYRQIFILDNADGLNISFASSSTGFRDAVTNMITQNRKDALADVGKGKLGKNTFNIFCIQPITSISEIEKMKSNSEVTFIRTIQTGILLCKERKIILRVPLKATVI